jgi:DNA replication licensing factor MCM4
MIFQISLTGEAVLNVNSEHLKSFNEELYRQLISYPQEVIPTLDLAVNDLFHETYPGSQIDAMIQVRPYNAEKTKNMRSLNPEGVCELQTICYSKLIYGTRYFILWL